MIQGQKPQNIPFITTEEMRRVDDLMVDVYSIALIQMMENAGRCLADLARDRFLDGDPRGRRVIVLAGTGGNGGGGLVCARRLHSWGAEVETWLTASPEDFTGVPRHQLDILGKIGIEGSVVEGDVIALPPADLIVDAAIGYSLRGAPYGAAALLIRAANNHSAPVLALDAPSGVDAGVGTVYAPAVQATVTMTLALPKRGLADPDAKKYVGELYLADIGVPPQLYSDPLLGLSVGPIFAENDIVRIW